MSKTDTETKSKELASVAAAVLGAKGGRNGTGKAKMRSRAHYKLMVQRRNEQRKRKTAEKEISDLVQNARQSHRNYLDAKRRHNTHDIRKFRESRNSFMRLAREAKADL